MQYVLNVTLVVDIMVGYIYILNVSVVVRIMVGYVPIANPFLFSSPYVGHLLS